ncbi:unnamed protein product [Bemisia tabaci]|uniref:Protein Wnt n=1 Tax=Bemisia tabaci TaxID=7038 RepID=A0A9P0ALD0_BEMTA|nr:unnamed protein product [Bemisia tabaci]
MPRRCALGDLIFGSCITRGNLTRIFISSDPLRLLPTRITQRTLRAGNRCIGDRAGRVGESRLFVERFPVGSAVCKVLPGMSKEQLALCYRNPDVIMAAVEGIHMAVDECKFQLKDNRWNCSTMETKNKNPHSSIILQRGQSNMQRLATSVMNSGESHTNVRQT